MPTDEVIENKDDLEKNTVKTGDDTDEQLPIDKGNTDEPEQATEQTGSNDGAIDPAPSPDPLPDTDGDEPSEAPAESEPDSDADADADSNDSHGDGESGVDVSDTVEADQADGDTDDDDDGAAAGVETESDSDTHSDDETADDSEQGPDDIGDEYDEAESCDESADELAGDSDTDTVEGVESAGDDSPDGTDADADTDTDTADSDIIDDVVTDSDTHATVPIDLLNIDGDSGKPVSLRDGINPEDEDTDRKSRVPHAVKVAAGVIATVAVTAALVTSAVAVMVVEIHPNVIGGETIASQQAGGIDGSGKKISASYTVGDALHSSDDSDGPEILSWTDCWYTVAPGAKSVRAEIESAGKGSRIDLSDGTSIDVDGRYASRAGSFDAGIDIEGIAKLYGGDDSWVAIRYDASHVLVGKRVAGGEGEGE